MRDQVLQGYLHDLDQRCRPDAEQQHRHGQAAQDQGLAAVDVLQFGHLLITDVTKYHAFDQPQAVGRTQNQRGRRQEGKPEIGLETGDDNQELTDETRSSG